MKKLLLVSALLMLVSACDKKESTPAVGKGVVETGKNVTSEPAKPAENKSADKTTVEVKEGRQTNVKTEGAEVKDGKIKTKNAEIDVKGGTVKVPGVSIKY